MINFLKLWSLCVLTAEEEEKKFFDIYKKHQEVIGKLPIKSKIDHYVMMNDFIKENNNNLENQFGIVQNNFNFIFNDFEQLKSSKEDIENKNIIVLFCSLRIDDSNTQSLNSAIKFFHDKYRENNSGTNLFIKDIINHYIQNWLQKETNNKCNSNLCKLLWEFLGFRNLGVSRKKFRVFPKMLENTIYDNRPIYSYLYLLKSFKEDPEQTREEGYQKCLSESEKILINTTKLFEDYKTEINQFFKKSNNLIQNFTYQMKFLSIYNN